MPDDQSPIDRDASSSLEAQAFQAVNPATGEKGRRYPGHTVEQARAIIADAARAQAGWRRTPFAKRAEAMRRAAQVIRKNRDRYAQLMTDEMGKTLTGGRDELEKCAHACDFYADQAENLLARRPVDMSQGHTGPGAPPKAFVTYNPLGVILAVMPWNFPFWQAIRFAAPNLMAGNGGVLKHASNVPGCALALEEVFRDGGFPPNLFRTVLIGSRDTKPLIEDPNIAAVTLTGSVAAGRAVAATAGGVLKKLVLELGGSDGYLVLEDADIPAAAKVCAAGRMVNGGQSCIAAKRFIVVEGVREAFRTRTGGGHEGLPPGRPERGGDQARPAGERAFARRHRRSGEEKHRGAARACCSAARSPTAQAPGIRPPVLTNVRQGQPAHDEEVFGPVAAVISATDEADAIRIANASEFGLGSAVMTRDLTRGERIAAEDLDAGMAFVNQNVRSDPRLPFGGVKYSGYGREVSDFGIQEFCNIKTVLVHEA